jgi:hypothetical protein
MKARPVRLLIYFDVLVAWLPLGVNAGVQTADANFIILSANALWFKTKIRSQMAHKF